MTRITDPMDWCELQKLAREAMLVLQYRRARCEHGYTQRTMCLECEVGCVTDMHMYAEISGQVAHYRGKLCWAVSDDMEDVAYLPAKFERRLVGLGAS